MHFWYTLPLQSEPWAIGAVGVGRKHGKVFPTVAPNMQLKAFQEAVKEELADHDPLPPGEYRLEFFVWRSIDSYTGAGGRKVVKNQVDATNIQKGLEDALQGVLFDNDRAVRDVRTVIVEQAPGVEPRVLIRASVWEGFDPDEIPPHQWERLDAIHAPAAPQSELDYGNADPLF